jgi:aryl-alcohol dehydrogenase
MRIRAAVVEQKSGPFVFRELDLDEPRVDEVLVRIVATGICQTDIHVRNQEYPVPLPLVLGHEGAGVVEQVGAGVEGFKAGDHVVMSYPSCGHCRFCHGGHKAYCEHAFEMCFGGSRLDGSNALHWPHNYPSAEIMHGAYFGQSSFATCAIASASNVVKVPSDLPLELLAPLGCGFQTGAGAVLNSLQVRAGSSLAVFGAGAVGLAAIMGAKIAGAAPIIAVDINPSDSRSPSSLAPPMPSTAARRTPPRGLRRSPAPASIMCSRLRPGRKCSSLPLKCWSQWASRP